MQVDAVQLGYRLNRGSPATAASSKDRMTRFVIEKTGDAHHFVEDLSLEWSFGDVG